jgi:hypothetical protein
MCDSAIVEHFGVVGSNAQRLAAVRQYLLQLFSDDYSYPAAVVVGVGVFRIAWL